MLGRPALQTKHKTLQASVLIKQKSTTHVQKCFPSYTTGGSEQQTDVQDAPSA